MSKSNIALRVAMNSIVGAIIYSIVTAILNTINLSSQDNNGFILTSVAALAILLWLVPFVFNKHPGEETLLSIILAFPAGLIIVSLINTLFNINLPILQFGEFAVGSLQFVLALTSYILADLIYLKIKK